MNPPNTQTLRQILASRGWPVDTLQRYLRFCVVGASGVVVDMAIFYLLAGPHPSVLRLNLSKFTAAEVAILSNFIWNELWTFRQTGGPAKSAPGRLSRFLRFNLICGSGVLITTALLNGMIYGLGMNVYLSNLVSIVVVSVWNFALSARFGWNRTCRQKN